MYHSIQLTHSTNPANQSLWRRGFRLLLFALAFAWFGLSPMARAVTPPPDGGYPNNNTAEGEEALFSLTTGVSNTAIGYESLFNNTTGNFNTAIGYESLFNNTTGNFNTATGYYSLPHNTTGTLNTGNGAYTLYSNTTGSSNTADGHAALSFNTTGSNNTATGYNALWVNTTGGFNTAHGVQALQGNTTGGNNTANGYRALLNNSTGNSNMASGYQALLSNTTGYYNTASGANALLNNTTGIYNTGFGCNALISNTTGYYNTATGLNALFTNTTGFNNTANGLNALYGNTSGTNNIALGYFAGANLTNGSNNIDIGNPGVAAEAGTIRIGTVGTQQAAYIAGISGKTVAGGVGVIVDSGGHLGTIVSSERFKDAIKPMDRASEAVLALEPVTFRYKQELDPEGIRQFGLVAEQVAKVDPDLVARDEAGKPYTVRYEAVNAMLLNEFLKEHRKVMEQGVSLGKQSRRIDEQQGIINEFKSALAQQQKEIKALTADLQKVSNQLEMTKPAARVIANN